MTKPSFVNGASLFAAIPDTMFLSGGSVRRALANNCVHYLSLVPPLMYGVGSSGHDQHDDARSDDPRRATIMRPSVYVRAMKEAGGME